LSPRKVVLTHRREHLDGHRVLEDGSAVLGAAGDGPAVAGAHFDAATANGQANASADQIAGLFLRMCMRWQRAALAHAKLGHQRMLAVNQSLALDPWQGKLIPASARFSNHG